MRGDDGVDAAAVQLAEDSLGDGPAGGGLRPGAELVDEYQGVLVGGRKHVLHVRQEGTVCREVVVDRLVVADTDHYALEDRKLGSLGRGDEHAPLEHILKQARSL